MAVISAMPMGGSMTKFGCGSCSNLTRGTSGEPRERERRREKVKITCRRGKKIMID